VRIRVRDGDARSATAELIVLPVPAGEQDGRTIRELARAAGGGLRAAIAAARFSGREGQVATVPLGGARRRTLFLVGLGDRAHLDLDGWRRAAGRGRRAADLAGARKVAIVVDAGAADARHLGAVIEGFRLAGYRFDKYKSDGDRPAPIAELVLLAPAAPAERALAPLLAEIDAAVEAVATVRDLVNEPAAVKTPRYLASYAERLAAPGLEVEVWDRARIEAESLAGLLAVARGSNEEPRFIRLSYRAPGARRRVALVGKGITFDSGGLSLKPAKAMETMKLDMAGGATVMAVMAALARARPAIDVDAFVPATENLPGGKAQKPGDVIRFRNGKTVEVLNTDAEGRLILADALATAAATEPDLIIDLATLTGACIVALGPQVAGAFGNDQATIDHLIAIGRDTGELLWQLPLVPEYRDDIKSPVADLKNVGGGNAGSITAALFLQEFVGTVRWVHLDIAGPAFTDKDLPYVPKGGTGFGVRMLLRYLTELAADPELLPARGQTRGRPRPKGRPGTRGPVAAATDGVEPISGTGRGAGAAIRRQGPPGRRAADGRKKDRSSGASAPKRAVRRSSGSDRFSGEPIER
jgi:leucyl aminopeptidase